MSSVVQHDEERRLREVEKSLEREDPLLAARLNPQRLQVSTRALSRCATAITVAGCGMVLMGIASSWRLAALGVLMVVVGFSLRLTLPTTVQVLHVSGNEGESGAGRTG